jgi:signal transduction histidine kinase/ActR/RegA family two-component response regulator
MSSPGDRTGHARARLHRLLGLTRRLSEPLPTDEVARVVAEEARAAVGAVAAVLWTVDDPPTHATRAHAVGTVTGALEGHERIPLEPGLPMGDALLRREPLFFESLDDLRDRYGTAAEPFGDSSHTCLPLVVHHRAVGGLWLVFPHARPFDEDDRTFLAVLAHYAAQALDRADLVGREKTAREQLASSQQLLTSAISHATTGESARSRDDPRGAERRLQNVLERLPIGVIVSRPPDSTLVFSNDAVARIWRTDSFPVRGEDRCKIMKASYPDGRPMPMAESPVVRALRGEVVEGIEARIERRDGTLGWVYVAATPVFRDDGSVEVAVATFVDVTAEKEARAAADEAGRAKDEFLAMLGHELRNPLAPIVTALHLMRLRGKGVLEHERSIIERQVSHLMRLVDDLLDVARQARGALHLQRALVEVSAVVADAVEVTGPLVEERKQKLTLLVPETGLVVDGDRGRLTQVVTNLLSNAAKYTPAGGCITVSARTDGDHIVVEVADDGAGIAPELLPLVFDPFTQGPQGLDRKQGGLGLGLAIARQLIVGHGGTIEAKSAGPGRGTVMVVRLPHAGEPSAGDAAAPAAVTARPRHGARRVLVVDDNPDAATLLAEALVEAGHEVRVVSDGPGALQLVETFVPDIAFLDIGLPAMDGYELARALRRIPGLARAPLVAITGYAQDHDRQRALGSGFDEHIAKPLHLDRVLECIERLSFPGAPAASPGPPSSR